MIKDKYELEKGVKKRKNYIIFLVMILIVVISFIIVFKTDLLTVQCVEIHGNHILSKNVIFDHSGIIIGQSIFKEKINRIQSRLLRNPYIKTVDIHRKLPNKFIIDVVERDEAAMIPFMSDFLIIDKEGMVLKSVSQNVNLKIIKGLKFSNFIEGKILKVQDKEQFYKALDIVNQINKNQIRIKEVDATNKKDIIIRINENLICKIGEGNHSAFKIKVLGNIIKDLQVKGIHRGIIDISHEGYPIYRPVE